MILKAADFGDQIAPASTTTDADEITRLTGLIALLEGRIRRAFLGFVQRLRSGAPAKMVSDLLERGDLAGALRVVDGEAQAVGTAVSRAVYQAAEAEAKTAPEALIGHVGIGFDPGNPRAASIIRQTGADAVRQITAAQRQAIQSAMAEAMQSGKGPEVAARAFRDAIGLTDRQRQSVGNYRRLLEQHSAEALERALRDRRFDASVQRAATTGEPLKAEQVDRMVDRYRDRMIASRADTIARTEGVKAASLGRQEAVAQTLEWSGLADDQVEKTWRAIQDKRTRDTHRHLSGQSVTGLQTPFRSISGATLQYPGDPAAPLDETINCRCALSYSVKWPMALAA
jgi:hypothetical protein